MLFRIENVDGYAPNLRAYDMNDYQAICIHKCEVHKQIANMIKDEVNGAKSRILHSYSRSLATCLFKYNKYTDNELHLFWDEYVCMDTIYYTSSKGNFKCRNYSIAERVATIETIADDSLFNKPGFFILNGFVIDISNNDLLDKYLRHYLGIGIKKFASPQKDCEVVVLNPVNDQSIRNYIGAVYVIYALQQKYRFLLNNNIRQELVWEIMNLDAFRFYYGEQERSALVSIVNYLAYNWSMEYAMSQGIYDYLSKQDHLSIYYDSILQYWGIMTNTFEESYNLVSYYQTDVVTALALKWCAIYLGKGSMLV